MASECLVGVRMRLLNFLILAFREVQVAVYTFVDKRPGSESQTAPCQEPGDQQAETTKHYEWIQSRMLPRLVSNIFLHS